MKLKNIVLLPVLLLVALTAAQAQAPKGTGSEYTYLYRLNKEQVRYMMDSNWVNTNYWLFTDLVDSTNRITNPSINFSLYPKGYYLSYNTNAMLINTQLHIQQQFFPTVQEVNGQWWFIIRDTLQNIVSNGQLTLVKDPKAKDTVFNYDESCMCYPVPKQTKHQWFLFESQGQFYYMYMNSPYYKAKRPWWRFIKRKRKNSNSSNNYTNYYYKPRLGRRILNTITRPFRHKWTPMSADPGYIVTNQPKYKHNDTLKMKAFLVNRKGKPLKKKMELVLVVRSTSNYYGYDTLLRKTIKPGPAGAYTYEMAIPDSFTIDKEYTLLLSRKNRTYEQINFTVEQYQLDKITYTWEDTKPEYYRGNSILFYAKAVDANNLPVPDATVRLKLIVNRVSGIYDTLIKMHDSVFNRTLFDTSLQCSPDGITPIELPGHLIPNADINISGEMFFNNADNKTGYTTHNFNVLANTKRYYIMPDSNGLRTGYLVQGRDNRGQAAIWRSHYPSGYYKDFKITLPYYHNWETGAQSYALLDSTGKFSLQSFQAPAQPPKQPAFTIDKQWDSVHITLSNPLGIQVAWRIYDSNDELIGKGGGAKLSFHHKTKGTKPVRVHYSYSWAGNFYTYETFGWRKEKQLTVKIEHPQLVFPGQAVPIDVTVTDYKNKPAKNVNLTAYSVNTEFNQIPAPQMPYYGKNYGGTMRKNMLAYPDKWTRNYQYSTQQNSEIFNRLNLYKHPYYRLLYARNAVGTVYDSLAQGKTQLSVYIKNTGYNAVDYYALWIDDEMVYYKLGQAIPNAFRVKTGKHKIKVRTQDGMYEVRDIECTTGMRTLVGINADSVYNNPHVNYTEIKNNGLLKEEKETYFPQNSGLLLLGADNYISTQKLANAYIRQGNKIYRVSHFMNSNPTVDGQPYTSIGPLQNGEVEIIIPSDTAFTFSFNSRFMYLCRNGKSISPYKESYNEVHHTSLESYHHFADTALEIPAPVIVKEEPKTNTIIHYKITDPLGQPSIRNFYPYQYESSVVHKYSLTPFIRQHNKPRRMWFFHQDSLPYSLIINNVSHLSEISLIPGRYNVVMFTDSNQYKIIYNLQLDSAYRHFYMPTLENYQPYDSVVVAPYIAQVKYLNRGPVTPFYNTPFKVNVAVEKEPSKNGEKLMGEFTLNGAIIQNALIVVEDGRGNYVSGGLSNQYGFYQIPLKAGTYTLKVYTDRWDMFLVEKITVSPNANTLADIKVTNYTNQIAHQRYDNLPQQQRAPQPTSKGKQPQYNSYVSGTCAQNCGEIRGLVTDAQAGEELIAATVQIEGTNIITVTDEDGGYRFTNLSPGWYKIIVRYVSYQTQQVSDVQVTANQTTTLNIKLRENVVEVQEVAIASYKKDRYDMLERTNSYAPSAIYSSPTMSVPLNDAVMDLEAISFRGARAGGTAYYVNGVAITDDIKVGDERLDNINLVDRNAENQRLLQMLGDSTAMRSRKDFRDYGFWVPNLTTNSKGKAAFTIRLPDNQTQWATFVPAMDGRRQTGLGTSYIKAYKPITANLSLPRFMVAGDRLQISGKTVNYTADSIVLQALLRVNDSTLHNSPLGVRYYNLVNQFLSLAQAGKYNLQYSVKMENGYTDGDIRELEVIENGLLINEGETRTLIGDQNFSLLPQEGRVNRQVLISNRKAELLLAEINQLKNYQYGCVEQTASKLKALLLEKQFQTALDVRFDGEKQIKECIKRLEKYQNANGSWGWWNKSATDYFMTIYAADALTRAQKAGYSTNAGLFGANYLYDHYNYLTIPQKLEAIALLSSIKYGADISQKQQELDKLNLNLQERLMSIRNRQLMGQKVKVDTVVKTVRHLSATKAAWGEPLFSIYVNELQTSAIAYQILRQQGGYDTLLKKVRNYFLQQAPTTRNTIQSATLLQTFTQDIVDEDAKREELVPTLTLNGKAEKRPSLKLTLGNTDTLTISKQGSELFYLYAWKKFVANPVASAAAFSINTVLIQGKHYGDTVKAGQPVTLQVSLSLPQSRDYVMLEVPIPAGFNYRSKLKGYNSYEVHREHFEDKVSIFFSKLPPGHYTFNIELMPQFVGSATLLPAHAEEMYFPMNSGNNTKRTVIITQ